jgi:hypothetical protein
MYIYICARSSPPVRDTKPPRNHKLAYIKRNAGGGGLGPVNDTHGTSPESLHPTPCLFVYPSVSRIRIHAIAPNGPPQKKPELSVCLSVCMSVCLPARVLGRYAEPTPTS